MEKTIVSFIKEHEESGLLLIDVPTGVGKTTAAVQHIHDHLFDDPNRIYLYLTPLTTNVQEAYDTCRRMFSAENKEKDFDSLAINLKSDLAMFYENVFGLDNELPAEVKALKSFKKLLGYWDKDQKIVKPEYKEDAQSAESEFRKDLQRILIGKFGKKSRAAIIKAIRESGEYKALLKLYPSMLSFEKRVFFMTVDKFMEGNSTIIEPKYSFLTEKRIHGAVVFLDEIDLAKEYILNHQIKEATRGNTDLAGLYRALNDKMFSGSLNLDMLDEMPQGQNFIKSNEDIYQGIKSEFEQGKTKYHLDSSFVLDNQISENTYFMMSDGVSTVCSENGQKDEPRLVVSCRSESRLKNIITKFDAGHIHDGNFDLSTIVHQLISKIRYAVRGLAIIADRSASYKNQKLDTGGERITRDEAISSVLENLHVGSEERKYMLPMMKRAKTDKREEIKNSQFNFADFYSRGFEIVALHNSPNHYYNTHLTGISLSGTPESFLVELAKTARVIGLSATADFPTVTGNFDICYLKKVLKDDFVELTDGQQAELDAWVRERLKENQRNVVVKVINDKKDDGMLGITSLIKDPESAKDKLEELRRMEKRSDNDIDSKNNDPDYNVRRFIKVASAIHEFLNNDYSKVLLILGNRIPDEKKKGIYSVSKMREFIADLNGIDQKSLGGEWIILTSQDFAIQMDKYKQATKSGRKAILFTCYQTAGTGKNLQMEVFDEITKIARKKDIDSVYLEKPTHLVTDPLNADTDEQRLKSIYVIHALSECGQIPGAAIKPLTRMAMGAKINSNYRKSMFHCPSTNAHQLKTLVQAFGRLCRVGEKGGNVYAYLDDDIVNDVDFSPLNNCKMRKKMTKEFCQLLDAIIEDKKLSSNSSSDFDSSEKLNLGSSHDRAIKHTIKKFLINGELGWTDESKSQWQRIRDELLANPCPTAEEAEALGLSDLYLESKDGVPMSKYYYGLAEGEAVLSYDKTKTCEFEISEDSACLPLLRRNKTIADKAGFPLQWNEPQRLLLPTPFRDIYKAAIGEKVIACVLDSFGLQTMSIEKLEDFEKFDFLFANHPDVAVDAKFWSFSSASDETGELSKPVQIEKIMGKLKQTGIKKAIIINLILPGAPKEKLKPHRPKEAHGAILVIPSLLDPFSDDSSVSVDAIQEIRDFIGE